MYYSSAGEHADRRERSMTASAPRSNRGLVAKGPLRRQAIARAGARVLRAAGVEGLTHRAVADEAGVPLGSTTYYFGSREELLEAATDCVVEESNEWLMTWTAETDPADFSQALTDLMYEYLTERRDEAVTDVELFVLAARRPELRVHTSRWALVTAQMLQKFVPVDVAEHLATVLHGISLVSIASDHPPTRDDIKRLLGLEALLVGDQPTT
jgi:DNA-binding transcriptional regulator YbjK